MVAFWLSTDHGQEQNIWLYRHVRKCLSLPFDFLAVVKLSLISSSSPYQTIQVWLLLRCLLTWVWSQFGFIGAGVLALPSEFPTVVKQYA